jgi:acetyl esterase/lipase
MPFRDLPVQSPINPRADVYVETALRLSRLAAMTTRCALDVPYGPDPVQRLDIYLPEREDLKDLPIFVNIHGGGWTHGYKEWMALNAPAIVAFPAIYVSIGYSLSPKDRRLRLKALEDCLGATAWLVKNIARYGGDPHRIHVGGHCTGGHLASLMVLRHDLLDDFGLRPDTIKSCFPYSGVYDVRDSSIYGVANYDGLGTTVHESPEDAAQTSPITFLAGNRTPFFVTWSENDSAICKAQGPAFAVALQSAGSPVEHHMFDLLDHFWIHIDQQRPVNVWTRTLQAWMTKGVGAAAPGQAGFAT